MTRTYEIEGDPSIGYVILLKSSVETDTIVYEETQERADKVINHWINTGQCLEAEKEITLISRDELRRRIMAIF